jgi:hypothetical protein
MARAALSLALLALLAASALAAPSVCVGRPGANGWSRLSPQAIKTSAVRNGGRIAAGRGRLNRPPNPRPARSQAIQAAALARAAAVGAKTISNYGALACEPIKPVIVKAWCVRGRRGRAPPAAASKFAPQAFAPFLTLPPPPTP